MSNMKIALSAIDHILKTNQYREEVLERLEYFVTTLGTLPDNVGRELGFEFHVSSLHVTILLKQVKHGCLDVRRTLMVFRVGYHKTTPHRTDCVLGQTAVPDMDLFNLDPNEENVLKLYLQEIYSWMHTMARPEILGECVYAAVTESVAIDVFNSQMKHKRYNVDPEYHIDAETLTIRCSQNSVTYLRTILESDDYRAHQRYITVEGERVKIPQGCREMSIHLNETTVSEFTANLTPNSLSELLKEGVRQLMVSTDYTHTVHFIHLNAEF